MDTGQFVKAFRSQTVYRAWHTVGTQVIAAALRRKESNIVGALIQRRLKTKVPGKSFRSFNIGGAGKGIWERVFRLVKPRESVWRLTNCEG